MLRYCGETPCYEVNHHLLGKLEGDPEMKKRFMLTFVATLGFSNIAVSGAEFTEESPLDGSISAVQLAEMGLGGMTPLSDTQAEEIRGSGYVVVYGRSRVTGGRPDRYFSRHSTRARGRSRSRIRLGNPYNGLTAWASGSARAFAY